VAALAGAATPAATRTTAMAGILISFLLDMTLLRRGQY
jgi:hypothetical protein